MLAPAGFTIIALQAVAALVVLRGALLLPERWPRLGGRCAASCGAGLALLSASVMATRSAFRGGPRMGGDVSAGWMAAMFGIWVCIGVLLAVRGSFAGRGSADRVPSRGWWSFHAALVGLGVLAASATLTPYVSAWRGTGPRPLVEVVRVADLLRALGYLLLAHGVGRIPPRLVSRRQVGGVMVAASVVGVPSALYAALRFIDPPPKRPMIPRTDAAAGPAAMAFVGALLIAALYVRRLELDQLEDAKGR